MNDIQITIDTPIFHNIDDIQSTLNEVPEGIMIPDIQIYHVVFTSLERLTIVIVGYIQIYYAVFTGNVKNYDEFEPWSRANPMIDILSWTP